MRWLFFVLRNISYAVSSLCVIYIIGFFYDKYRSHQNGGSLSRIKIYQAVVVVAIISTIMISAPFQLLFQIGNISFKPEGEYCYYVVLENDEGTYSKTVPARIRIEIDSEDDEGMYGEQRSILYVHYYLEDAYFENNSLFFYDENEVKINEPEVVLDENDNYWICTLLNEKAYYPRLKLDNGITVFDTILFCIILVVLITAWILMEIEKHSIKKQ